MKRWEQPIVNATYVPRFAEILARSSLCIGSRSNLSTGRRYAVRVYSRDETPLADAIVMFHVQRHGA